MSSTVNPMVDKPYRVGNILKRTNTKYNTPKIYCTSYL